jgi:CRP/FNR family cyclic AMP-dependent transcriptional regulator
MSDTGTQKYATDVARELVKSSPLAAELSDEQCDTLAGVIRVSGLKANEFLLEEGRTDDSLHVVASGKLEVVKVDKGGDYVTLHVLQPGDMAGELGFIDGAPHSAGLRAIGECEVFNIHRGDLESLIGKDPDLVYKVMRAIMRTVHKIVRRMNLQYAQLTDYIVSEQGGR